MKKAIRVALLLVIAARSGATLADDRAGVSEMTDAEHEPVWTERYPDDAQMIGSDSATAAREQSPAGEPARGHATAPARTPTRLVTEASTHARAPGNSGEQQSSDARWLQEREGYRDGGY